MHVLVCDDDASTRFAARRLLEEHFGCVVQEAPGGAEALTLLAQRRFTFLLLDIDMPGLSGHDTLEEIRASELTRALPVVILSNERREDAIIKLMELGVSGYIVKPIVERHRQGIVEYRRGFTKIDAVLLEILCRLLRIPRERHRRMNGIP